MFSVSRSSHPELPANLDKVPNIANSQGFWTHGRQRGRAARLPSPSGLPHRARPPTAASRPPSGDGGCLPEGLQGGFRAPHSTPSKCKQPPSPLGPPRRQGKTVRPIFQKCPNQRNQCHFAHFGLVRPERLFLTYPCIDESAPSAQPPGLCVRWLQAPNKAKRRPMQKAGIAVAIRFGICISRAKRPPQLAHSSKRTRSKVC